MTRPKIQIDNEVRKMTEQKYADLLATGWTLEPTDEMPTTGVQRYACTCLDRVRNNTNKRANKHLPLQNRKTMRGNYKWISKEQKQNTYTHA